MTKFLSLLLILPAAILSMSANHVSPRLKASIAGHQQVRTLSEDSPVEYYPVIMRLTSHESASELESVGVVLWHVRGNLAVGCIPADVLSDVISSDWISAITTSESSVPVMDKAAASVGLDKVRNQVDLNKLYTGEGVVVGFCDIGFDPSHINFLNDDGTRRTVFLTNYDGPAGTRTECSTPSEIEEWVTDTDKKYHATHVCGILAGHAPDSPYNGVATRADIVAATSALYGAEILAGIEDVVKYAQSVGKPAVVNLSLASSMGPHDGTQLFNEYIDLLGEEAIIVVSAGNANTNPVVVSKVLAENDTQIATGFMDEWIWQGFKVRGEADFWSAGSDELATQLLIIADGSGDILGEINIENDEVKICSHETYHGYPGEIMNPDFDKYYNGTVSVYSELNPLNDRYNVYVSMNYQTRNQEPPLRWASTWVGIRLNGTPGTRVDGYAGSGIHFGRKSSSFCPVSGAGSISDIATARNVISVGAYCTRNSVVQIDGTTVNYPEYVIDEMARFSSYGTLVDGRVMPVVSAPGATTISSVSTPFLENGGSFSPLAYTQTRNGKTYYWGAEAGTSMSSPLVAGGIALWLEADPSLNIDDVFNILAETSPLPRAVINPGWGRGRFNLYAGLHRVKKTVGVENVTSPLNPVVSRVGNSLTVCLESGSEFSCSLSSMSGIEMISTSGSQSVTLSLDPLPRGVYLLTICHDDTRHTLKVLR
ncbi:MAG: S8 family peptidase [Muribaculaceae bacterium]|nr:S8 family peptidase [Muribaculaceae bacterium]